MKTMSVVQNLSDAWLEAVRSRRIVNVFETNDDQKAKVEFGLVEVGGKFDYYAKNLTTGEALIRKVEDRAIEGTDFRIQYNGYRALRPRPKALNPGRQPDVSGDVMQCKFYCQDPKQNLSMLRRDALAQVTLKNWRWNAYYNATPFEKEGHLLWLPASVDGTSTVLPHLSQELTLPILEDMLSLFLNSDSMLLFFNSLHAGATVNHMHWQAVFHERELAIETAQTRKAGDGNGDWQVLDNYPANGLVFDRGVDPGKLFAAVKALQDKKVPYNLILVGKRICLMPRNKNHEVIPEFPGGAVASMELAGKIIIVDEAAFKAMDSVRLRNVLQKVTRSSWPSAGAVPIKEIRRRPDAPGRAPERTDGADQQVPPK